MYKKSFFFYIHVFIVLIVFFFFMIAHCFLVFVIYFFFNMIN